MAVKGVYFNVVMNLDEGNNISNKIDINTMLCPIKVNSNTIFDLLCVKRIPSLKS